MTESTDSRRKEHTGGDLIRHIHATQMELEGWKKLNRPRPNAETGTRIVRLAHELHQSLIDYVIERANKTISLGQIVFTKHDIGATPERQHAFSKNRVAFLLPSPLQSERGVPFVVETTLLNLRRKGEFPNSLATFKKIKPLVKPTDFVDESQSLFVARTVEEIFAVEMAKTAVGKNDPTNPAIAQLRDVQEYLVIGRLLALTQHERVPGLQVAVERFGGVIRADATWGNTQLTPQVFPVQSPGRPAESVLALTTAGLI